MTLWIAYNVSDCRIQVQVSALVKSNGHYTLNMLKNADWSLRVSWCVSECVSLCLYVSLCECLCLSVRLYVHMRICIIISLLAAEAECAWFDSRSHTLSLCLPLSHNVDRTRSKQFTGHALRVI